MMIKIFTLFTVLIMMVHTANAAFTESAEEKKILHTSSPALQGMIAGLVTDLNGGELTKLTGRHLTFRERIALTLFKLTTRYQQKQERTKGFNLIGFIAPLLLGIIGLPLGLLVGLGFALSILTSLGGVALMYATSKDRNRHKWAWIGFGAYIVGLIVLIIVIITSGNFG